jgi:Tfp pilus assembly PilM family ATPase
MLKVMPWNVLSVYLQIRLPMGVNTVGILDIGHTMTTLSVMQNKLFIPVNRFSVETTDPRNSKRYGLSFEEAGRAKKERLCLMIMILKCLNLS